MAEAVSAQMVVSMGKERAFMPMPEIMMSTGGPLLGARVAWTAEGERMSPGVMERWLERVDSEMPLERRREVRFEGVRATGLGVLDFEGWTGERGEVRAEQW